MQRQSTPPTSGIKERLGGRVASLSPTPAKAVSVARGGTVWTVTLEDQGIPADIARHRRSVNGTQSCEVLTTVERYDKKKGIRRRFTVRCQAPAVAIDDHGINRCEAHR